jgi:hypothetical protein
MQQHGSTASRASSPTTVAKGERRPCPRWRGVAWRGPGLARLLPQGIAAPMPRGRSGTPSRSRSRSRSRSVPPSSKDEAQAAVFVGLRLAIFEVEEEVKGLGGGGGSGAGWHKRRKGRGPGVAPAQLYSLTVFGVQLRGLPRPVLCVLLMIGIYSSWFMHGYCEERLSRLGGEDFPMWLLTFIQFSSVAGLSSASGRMSRWSVLLLLTQQSSALQHLSRLECVHMRAW